MAPKEPQKLEMSVSAEDFALDYAENKVSADATYKGKRVEFLGALDKPGQNSRGTYIDIRADKPESWRHTYTEDVEGARCYVDMDDAAQKDAVAKVYDGALARVTGTVTGPIESDFMVLGECTLDAPTLGKDSAMNPTILAPRRGSASDCALLDVCCPSKIDNAMVSSVCGMANADARSRRKTTDCAQGVDTALIAYKTAGVKPPAGCKPPK